MNSNKWMKYSLGDICSFISGTVFPRESQNSLNGTIPFIKVSDLNTIGNERWIDYANNYISETEARKLRAKIHPPLATTFAKIGVALTYNRRRLLRNETIVDNNMASAVPNKSIIDPIFFYYLLLTIDFNVISSGTALPYLNISDLEQISVRIPSLATQRDIAKILSALDDKIELNRRTNVTLEAITQAIFKEWFIDFNFPGATSELVDSELGLIPKTWRVGELKEISAQRIERINASIDTELMPYVPIDVISSRSLFLSDSKSGLEAKTSLIRFYQGDILFGAMRPYFHKVCIAPFDGTTRTTAFVLFPRLFMDYSYMVIVLNQPSTIDYASNHSTGSTIPYTQWTNSLEDMPILLPPKEVREKFDTLIRPLLNSISPKYYENQSLSKIRDTLLPKLITRGFEE